MAKPKRICAAPSCWRTIDKRSHGYCREHNHGCRTWPRHTVTGTVRGCAVTVTADTAEQASALLGRMG